LKTYSELLVALAAAIHFYTSFGLSAEGIAALLGLAAATLTIFAKIDKR